MQITGDQSGGRRSYFKRAVKASTSGFEPGWVRFNRSTAAAGKRITARERARKGSKTGPKPDALGRAAARGNPLRATPCAPCRTTKDLHHFPGHRPGSASRRNQQVGPIVVNTGSSGILFADRGRRQKWDDPCSARIPAPNETLPPINRATALRYDFVRLPVRWEGQCHAASFADGPRKPSGKDSGISQAA